jgi:hypothetical protein
MMVYELLVRRVHLGAFHTRAVRPLDSPARIRIARRWFAQSLLFALAAGLYGVLPEYANGFQPFFDYFAFAAVAWLLVSPLYFGYVECFARFDPADDALLRLWDVLGRASRGSFRFRGLVLGAYVRKHRHDLLSWTVKLFFLPLMVTAYFATASSIGGDAAALRAGWAAGSLPTTFPIERWFMAMTHSALFLDLALCVIGYTFTLRLLDSHVRNVDDTLLGWVAALACYPPFNGATEHFLRYDDGGWQMFLRAHPEVMIAAGVLGVISIGVYTWATLAFGFRFSNLTHRGIIATGPYRWVRHPAYASKNLWWWLTAMPFFSSFTAFLGLLGWNAVYVMRAMREERHLSRDPAYRAYCAEVRWRFIHGVW